MKASPLSIAGIVVSLTAGILAACGGGYGGGGGGGNNPPATLNFAVDPGTITVGESATLTWNSNGNTCTASGDWTGMKPGDGTEVVTPADAGTFTYSLRCRGGGYGDSEVGSATLTVDAARVAGLFAGDACCVDGQAVAVSVLTSGDGHFRLLARGVQVVGQRGKTPMTFEASDTGLAGRRLADSHALQQLAVTGRASARGTILVKDHAVAARRLDFNVPSERTFGRKAGLAALQGSFSALLGNGYSLTLTIDRTGEVFGADSRGCVVRGAAAAPRGGAGAFRVRLDVASCGASNGRFLGEAALVEGTSDRPAGLFLSVSNANAAIGWRLSR